jgi:uncharacterized protein YggU (UPF0235/DUF167 family)
VPGGHYRTAKGGIELFVRLTPRSSKDEVAGVEAGADGRAHLAARVRAVPDKGKANEALERLVADWLGVPRSSVRVSAGATQRLKTLRIDCDPAGVAARIDSLSG